VRTAPPEGSRSGSGVSRNPNSSSSSSQGGQRSGVAGDPSSAGGGADPRFRNRAGRPMTGVAIARERSGAGISALGSWGLYYPWYGSGLNWSFGYAYNPFLSGYSRWTWGRYGMWADPYDPFGYGYGMGMGYPYGYGYGYGSGLGDPFYSDLYADAYGYGGGGGGSYSSSRGSERPEPTGSVRLRVKPASAKVYLDGTMIGVVDDFDGLTSHLAAPAGRHEIEVRADGYETLKISVDVEADKTVTARGTLRKK
jgi:hypothetical protein